MLLNCGVREDSWESLGLQGDPTSPSILKEMSPGCSLEGLMLKLKLQYFGHLMRRADSFENTLMLGKGRRRRDDKGWDGWMASPTQWTWVWVDSGSWWWTGRPGVLWFMGSQRVGHDWVTELILQVCFYDLLFHLAFCVGDSFYDLVILFLGLYRNSYVCAWGDIYKNDHSVGHLWWASGSESTRQGRRHRLDS